MRGSTVPYRVDLYCLLAINRYTKPFYLLAACGETKFVPRMSICSRSGQNFAMVSMSLSSTALYTSSTHRYIIYHRPTSKPKPLLFRVIFYRGSHSDCLKKTICPLYMGSWVVVISL